MLARLFSTPARIATVAYAGVWLILSLEWCVVDHWPFFLRLAGFSAGVGLAGAWGWWARGQSRFVQWSVASLAFFPVWQTLILLFELAGLGGLRQATLDLGIAAAFLIGLGWTVWGLERASRACELRRLERQQPLLDPTGRRPADAEPNRRIWNPLDPAAWYYGRSRRLNQSLTALFGYSFLFLLLFLMLNFLRLFQGDMYELPAGGGGGAQQVSAPRKVQIKKIIRKTFIINPFSLILWNPPPIEKVELQLEEATAHEYKVGQGDSDGMGEGEGEGAGFGAGTRRGKVRFIRLEYAGGDWDQDFGIGADVNMLNEYHIRTKQPCHHETESRSITQLKGFPPNKSPPFVYMTGQRSISLSDNEIKILREYLLDRHGMIFADNGGSGHWHNQFVQLMSQVLERKVEPVRVPLDDIIHSRPYGIPFLPYVAPHGGKEALGWKVEGRWVCYYHPGDIGDAWADDHAGVSREVTEYCYQLGTNVMYYANAEYSKWVLAQRGKPAAKAP